MWAAAPAADPQVEIERRLEAALYREVVLGDLSGALEQYRAIASSPGNSREVAARTQAQIAQCLEKQGNRQEALAAWRRVLNEFGDYAPAAGAARARLAGGSGPVNLDFAKGQAGKAPPGWQVPALPKDADYMAEVRRDGCRSARCAVVLVPENAPRPFSYLLQSFSAAPYRGATVRLRAWVRVEQAGPDDRAQMRLSVDRENRGHGFYDNGDDRPVRSNEWTQCEIVGKVHEDATFIDIGVMSIGRGRVWVDSVSFEVLK